MINVEINRGDVTIKIIGFHKMLTLRSVIHFKKNVVSVTKTGEELQPPSLFRTGTTIPGLICGGTLSGQGQKEFWDRTKNGLGICIELAGVEYTGIVADAHGSG
jgi:hypothetical protein